ncbi:hypothetical protein CIHG_02210 [Coccidioides immitis H538.4]|uniref:Uncharacterized protein n=2 Tax=Coccidioides immitis TaxID=5501 RepID=A0A0J8RGX9_COCIT|nr:hypothetical protein CIRG_00380 [Coccidioides immitis RMSCC 2394]KMU84425.1 hypothetical protein CIHG_02210 [Coccidioides immitis H538.4]
MRCARAALHPQLRLCSHENTETEDIKSCGRAQKVFAEGIPFPSFNGSPDFLKHKAANLILISPLRSPGFLNLLEHPTTIWRNLTFLMGVGQKGGIAYSTSLPTLGPLLPLIVSIGYLLLRLYGPSCKDRA